MFCILLGWPVPYENLIFTDFPRRNHPGVPGKPWEVAVLVPAKQQTNRCVFSHISGWSVPTDQPVSPPHLSSRSHSRIPWKPGEVGAIVPERQPTRRSVSLFLGWPVPHDNLLFYQFLAPFHHRNHSWVFGEPKQFDGFEAVCKPTFRSVLYILEDDQCRMTI